MLFATPRTLRPHPVWRDRTPEERPEGGSPKMQQGDIALTSAPGRRQPMPHLFAIPGTMPSLITQDAEITEKKEEKQRSRYAPKSAWGQDSMFVPRALNIGPGRASRNKLGEIRSWKLLGKPRAAWPKRANRHALES